jgi:tetratricopeptide (TPR) repeat protein
MRLGLALLAGLVALPAAAQESPGAISVLVRQAERWLAQERPDLAAPAIERALAADPNNGAALAVAARLELARGNRDAANALLGRLQQSGDTGAARQVQDAIRSSGIDRTALEEARRLAREGRALAAVQRYRALFGNQPPPEQFALEFAQALSGAPETRREGIQALATLASRSDANNRTRLAHAQALTFDPATRSEGIMRLGNLADQPDVAQDARRAWAAAIGFSGDDPAIAPQAEAYARRFPDDVEMRRRVEGFRAAAARAAAVPQGVPDPNADARAAAFQRLEAGQTAESARRFEEILRANPQDADALGGLGIIRLREGNNAQARSLLERAIANDPAGARNWQRALDAASYGDEVTASRAALRRGDAEGAEILARRAALREVEDRSDAETALGEIALRRGDPTTAEQRFRAALSRRPGFPPAQAGLQQALRAQGRAPEPAQAAAGRGEPRAPDVRSAEPRFAAPAEPRAAAPELSQASGGAAGNFRSEASRVADPGVQVALLRNALAAAPDDPWVRLDLARALRRQGRASEGRAIVEELAIRAGSADATFAAALMAEEDGRVADADSWLNRIPAARRSADMARLASRIRSQREVAAGAALYVANPIEGRSQLLMLAARPDPTGGIAGSVIRAFNEAGDRAGAAEAGRVAAIANRGQTAARVAIAGSLLGAGLEAEATALAAEIEAGNASAEVRRDLAALRQGAAIRAADRLNEQGDQAGAYERLRPALAGGANNDAQLALARLYMGARQPTEALRIAEAVLARDPRNVDARRSAIEAAIATGDRNRAARLLAEGQSAMPSDSRVLLLEARVARDAGDAARARQALEAASRQRAAELGSGARGAALAGTAPGAAASNPFGRGPVAIGAPADRLAREIEAELSALRDDAGPSLAGIAGGRMRSGDQGLDKLSEVSVRAEAVVQPPIIGGRLSAYAEPVAIDNGGLSSARQAQNRFGTLALNNASLAGRLGVANPNSSASGVAVGVAYQRGDWLRMDVGTTPIGFTEMNVVGGVEVAPRLTDAGVRMRVGVERRGMNDSLLSWSGATDPRTGTTWGPVLRTGARGQVEVPLGTQGGYGYVGGGYSMFEGPRVASNSRFEGGAGISVPVYRDGPSELRMGTDLVYLAYERNLRYFTLGHGGYFSPQQYTALNFPVDYRSRVGDLSYRVGATLGYASWREDQAPYFPNDTVLQAQLAALSVRTAGTDSAVNAVYRGQAQAGAVGGVRADVDYPLNDSLSLGAGFRYDKASNFDETRFQLRVRNRF